MTQNDTHRPLGHVADQLDHVANEGDVTYDHVIRGFGRSAFATCLLVPALVLASPLSGVPLLSTIFGAVIFLVAMQGLIGRRVIWLPGFLRRRKASAVRVRKAAGYVRKAAGLFDKLTRDRLHWIIQPQARRVLYAVCAVAGLALPVLEFVPFSSSIVGAGIAFVAFGMLARDGIFPIIGLPIMTFGLSIPLFLFRTVFG